MNGKVVGSIIAALIAVAAIAGIMVLSGSDATETSDNVDDTAQEQVQTEEEPQAQPEASPSAIDEHLEGANLGETVDATGQERVEISITDYMYAITDLTISEGTTVVWTNDGGVAHDVTSDTDDTELGSPLLSSGETYEFTFDEAGEYLYHCSPHPFRMRAAITVVE